MASNVANSAGRVVTRKSFFQKWIVEAKPGYAIMFIAPWSSVVAFITIYHKTVGDNSFFFFQKKNQFIGEGARDSDVYTFPMLGGRQTVQHYIDNRRQQIGGDNIRINPQQKKSYYE